MNSYYRNAEMMHHCQWSMVDILYADHSCWCSVMLACTGNWRCLSTSAM